MKKSTVTATSEITEPKTGDQATLPSVTDLLSVPVDPSVRNRLLGALQTVGGIGEMTVASVYIAETGGMGSVLGGGVLLAHGADGTATGAKQLWTGKQQETLTQQMLEPVVGKKVAAISDAALSLCSGGAHIAITRQCNLLMFGTPTKPYLFRTTKTDDLRLSPAQIDKFSLDQVRAMKGKETLMYVVTKDGELLLTKEKFAQPLIVDGKTLTRVHHPEIAGKSIPVASAGEVSVLDGKIIKIDNFSGRFRPYGEKLKEITEHAFNRHGFQEAIGKFGYFGADKGLTFGEWGNKPIAQHDWVWPVLIAGGIGASRMAPSLDSTSLDWLDSIIPSAYASSSTPEGSFPLGFSAQELIQARNLFKDPSSLTQATPQTITAALFMKQDSSDLFDLGATAKSIAEPQLHRALRKALTITAPGSEKMLPQLISSSMLGEPSEVSRYYLTTSLEKWFEDYTDTGKKQAAKRIIDDLQQTLDSHEPVPKESADAFAKLMLDEVAPTLEVLALRTLIASYNTNVDITGFEKEATVMKPYQELQTLTAQGAAPHEKIAKTKEVQDNIFRVKLQRQDFDNKLRHAGYTVEALSQVARLTHNKDIGKVVTVLASGLEIGRNVAALADLGTLAGAVSVNPIGAVLAITSCLLNIADVFSSDSKDSSVVIMEALQQLSEQVNQLRTEMHARFDAVMQGLDTIYRKMYDFYYALQGSLDEISDRLKYMQESGQRFHQKELSYLETIVANLENLAQETKKTHKVG